MQHKTFLHIDLNDRTAQFKLSGDLYRTVGGVVMAHALLSEYFDESPIVLASGPLVGYFPYISKCCFLTVDNYEIVELYGGGSIGAKMNFANIDAIIITGEFKGMAYKVDIFESSANVSAFTSIENIEIFNSSDISIKSDMVSSKGYFSFGSVSLSNKMSPTEGICINIDHSSSREIPNAYEYEKLYKSILSMYKDLSVDPGNNPSCIGCPIGCEYSALGEDHLNISILPRSLVACGYAASIYKSIPVAYACLQSVGYFYTHHDLETLPVLMTESKEKINLKLK